MKEFTLNPLGSPKKELQKPKPKLSNDEFMLLLYYEQTFWETGGLPTHEVTARYLRLNIKEIEKAWLNETFIAALASRNIDIKPNDSVRLLTPKQLTLANLLMNAHDPRSVREKLEEAGVSSQQYHAWRRQKPFTEYMRKRAEGLYKGSDDVAFTKLVQGVEEGDKDLLKLFFEMRGIHNPRLQVDINVQSIVVQVVEIISNHVKDPIVLDAIATDIAQLAEGN